MQKTKKPSPLELETKLIQHCKAWQLLLTLALHPLMNNLVTAIGNYLSMLEFLYVVVQKVSKVNISA